LACGNIALGKCQELFDQRLSKPQEIAAVEGDLGFPAAFVPVAEKLLDLPPEGIACRDPLRLAGNVALIAEGALKRAAGLGQKQRDDKWSSGGGGGGCRAPLR
jgi:hypothetical protein